MSVHALPSSSNINVAVDFTQLIGLAQTDASHKNILEDTDPQFGNTNNLRVVDYYGFGGYYLYNMSIRSSDGTRGYVQYDYPWSEQSTGTNTIGNTKQAFENNNPALGFTAVGTYPYVFDYWLEVNSFTFYYSASLSFIPYDVETQDPGALFIAYFA